jgi:L-ascorbate metabolism protein UlaG (beta-lactamase superfamily)
MKDFLKSDADGVFYIGHASALVRINGKLILFDPVWNHSPYGHYWEFIPEQINLDFLLDEIDLCVVSHIHEDHICEPILRKLKCPVLVMSGRPNLTARIKKYADIVITAPPFKWVSMWKGVELYFVPHAFNSIDSSCFVRSKHYCVYHGNDNFLSDALIKKIKPDVKSVDVAMVPFAFIHYYPFLLDGIGEEYRLSEINRLNKQSLDQAYMFVDTFKPKITIPFGNSLFHVENDFLNQNLLKANDFKSALPMYAGSWVMGNQIHLTDPNPPPDLSIIKKRVKNAEFTLSNYEIVVNDVVVDAENLTVKIGKPSKNHTKFTFKPMEFKQWLRGEITLEQAIGTRQFRYSRVPEIYDLKIVEFYSKCL